MRSLESRKKKAKFLIGSPLSFAASTSLRRQGEVVWMRQILKSAIFSSSAGD